jgi:hypothetical protein
MELVKEGGILVLTGLAPSSQTVVSLFRVIHEQFQVNLVFTFKKETFQFSKNIPFLLKAFWHIYDDKWLPDLAKFYQIRGGYHSSCGAPGFLYLTHTHAH